ncbi:decaprenyl-phosphate phosphoribosyltransferase [Sciscionella sediminilitoris]|uniref:decaprenyl-phosphate phosphoribosyltransferase n=1 Tax=Sciscionella sediminilitoris TaxID=1445613 RepID=UPI0004DF06A9|nr:decaprenyl-phosphate phosphoribosyltransferase [Sciscionella sp. SE31]
MSETTQAQTTAVKPVRLILGLIAAIRPKQWIKNVLVATAPFVAGQLFTEHVLLATILAFVVFTVAAAGTYLINDARDVEADRRHPKKQFRPIASGAVPLSVAYGVGIVLMLAALALCLLVSWQLLLVIAAYEVIQLAYCFGLKHQPVLEMFAVASGFVLRAVTGGVATEVKLSPWFVMFCAFGALYMVAGKRAAERALIDKKDQKLTRKVLHSYSPSYLRFVWALAATVTVVMYTLWTLTVHPISSSVWSWISVIPFVIAILRYAVDVDNDAAGAPEDIVLGDPVLPILGILWAATVTMAVYIG